MIDLHAHILPAVDDGPVNLGEALAMARAAAADGVRTIVATPHSGDWQPPLSAVAL
ncbi:MAG: CpsB/CapC family capsule biosynthesis tyrosine phosphatase, partial [Chloroflexota bacterium]|nr:CpsB/CapC family capsule biosynthesis tyrosine phosphatase [Chloroflexota bacterium]